MQKAEPQHKQTHHQPAATQRKGTALESPQGEQIAQLEAMAAGSPQVDKLAQLAATANASPQAEAQRRMMGMIHHSPRMAAQRKVVDTIGNSTNIAAQREEMEEPLQAKVAQREEAPAKRNDTGLPDNLKSGIESLSDISMDNVRVHYNSSQPAQLNAHAYAQGTDIHVAPGQERHLPHEAWHVVQQAQRRVRPTLQMKGGVPVNDDQGLEHEADVMGERALRFPAAAQSHRPAAVAQAAGLPRRPATASAGIVQRIITEVTPKSDTEGVYIASVNIVGRPPSPYGSTMGDHSTAFSVHSKGLALKLTGISFDEGFKILESFYEHAKTLPGWNLIDNLPHAHKTRLRETENKLVALLRTPVQDPVTPGVVIAFQNAVNEFLEFRELLPLSTMNVKVKSGKAGKGKGESKQVGILEAFEAKGVGSEQLKDAVIKLFDDQSAGMSIAEQDEDMLAQMLPGMDPKNSIEQRIEDLITQHLASVNQAFPRAYGAVHEEEVRVTLAAKLKTEIKKEMQADFASKERSCINPLQHEIAKLKEEIDEAGGGVSTIRKSGKTLKQEELENKQSELTDYESAQKAIRTSYLKLFGEEIKSSSVALVAPPPGPPDRKKRKKSESASSGATAMDLTEENGAASASAEGKSQEGEPLEEDELDEKKAPLAMQIQLDDANNISRLDLGGRTASPFSGTMGGHTTAWTVHLDGIRRAVTGKTIEDATTYMRDTAVPNAKELQVKREKLFSITFVHGQKLSAARQALLDMDNERPEKGDDLSAMFHLQQLIRAYLTYLNFIPGSTIDKGDTGGKSEGAHRKVLLAFEAGEPAILSELDAAVRGMLDTRDMNDDAKIKMLETDHEKFIREAYPLSYEVVIMGRNRTDESLFLPEPTEGKKRKKPIGEEEYTDEEEYSDEEENSDEEEYSE